MGCHTWFFRPTVEGEKAEDTCEYSEATYGDDRYTDIDTPHDTFRINFQVSEGVYLKSLEQTLEFVAAHKDQMSFLDCYDVEIRKFWKENPEGIIEFG